MAGWVIRLHGRAGSSGKPADSSFASGRRQRKSHHAAASRRTRGFSQSGRRDEGKEKPV